MRRTRLMLVATMAAGISLGVIGTHVLNAQQTGIKRTMLMKKDLAGIEGKEAFMGTAELAPGVAAGKHYHHGHELGYVLEGSGVLEVEGQPPIAFKAGDTYHIDANKPHDARNTGTTPAKVLAIWLVEKGKPLAVPVQ